MFRISYLILISFIQNVAICQADLAVKLSGSIWDDSTALKMPVEIFKKVNGTLYKISTNQPNGDFTADITKDTEAIIFSLEKGNKQFPLPVVFYGEFRESISASFSLNVSPNNLRYSFNVAALIFGKPMIPATKYDVQHFRGDELHCEIEKPNGSMMGASKINQIEGIPPDNNSHYVLMLSNSNQQNIGKVNYRKHRGMVFIDTNTYGTERKTNQISNIVDEGLSKVITFNQSVYDINVSELSKLDSIVKFCRVHPSKLVKVKGFTDGVGDSHKNETLSMYRAKVVSTYLVSRGIEEDRIELDWEKESPPGLHNGELERFRKVEINIK